MWNMNTKRDKPEHRFLLGIIVIVSALSFASLVIAFGQRGVSIGIVVAGSLLCYGLYVVLTLPAYKERYFPKRFTAEPVAPDGSKPEDNSEELQKQIEEEKTKDSLTDLKQKVLFAIMVMLGIVVASIIEREYLFLPAICMVLIYLIKYLRSYSPKVRIWANKIGVYSAVYLILVTLPLIFIAYKFMDESFELILALTTIFFMAVIIMINAITTSYKQRIEDRNKANQEAEDGEQGN